MKLSWNFAKIGLGDGMNMCSQHSGYIERYPIHACQARPPPFSYYSIVTATQLNATTPNLDDEGMEGLHNLIDDRSEALRQVQDARNDLQHHHKQKRLRREYQNAGIRRTSTSETE